MTYQEVHGEVATEELVMRFTATEVSDGEDSSIEGPEMYEISVLGHTVATHKLPKDFVAALENEFLDSVEWDY
jgi:hypothetical protein